MLFQYLSKAADTFFRAKNYISAIEVHNLLISLFTSTRQFSKLNETYQKASKVSQAVIEDTSPVTFKFFRVAFFGKIFGRKNGKSYIYKDKMGTRIMEFKDKILVKIFLNFVFPTNAQPKKKRNNLRELESWRFSQTWRQRSKNL